MSTKNIKVVFKSFKVVFMINKEVLNWSKGYKSSIQWNNDILK